MRQFIDILLKKCPVVVTAGLVLSCSYSLAQEKIQFTQYMFNGLVINPAYAGADEALSLTFVQRSQWAGVDQAPTTQSLSAHTLFKQRHTGIGLTLVNDRIGVHKNLDAMANYAYHLRLDEHRYLSMGLLAGIHSRKSDYASLSGSSNNDPRVSTSYFSHTYFDFGTGVYYRSPRLHAGISVPELLPKRVSYNDTLSIQLTKLNVLAFSKYRFMLNDDLDAEPSLLLKFLPGVPFSFDVNANLIYRNVLTVGLSYRKTESIDFLLKGQLTPQLQFGYSYDYPVGILARLSNGSHEIMVQYLFRYVKSNVASPR